MIESKRITAIVALLTLAACLFTGVFLFCPQVLRIVSASSQPEYTALFDPLSVMIVEITVDQTEWEQMLEEAIDEQYISCDVTINGQSFSSVGIRPKGNSSLSTVYSSDSDRYSFKLEFDHYVSGQSCLGLDKFVLNNMQSDATYLKEYLSYDLMRQMGVPTPLYCFAQITVNGQPWGFYLAIEALEESFAQRNFGTQYGQLYKPDSMDLGGGAPKAPDGGQQPELPGSFSFPEKGREKTAGQMEPPAQPDSQGEAGQGQRRPDFGFGGPGGGSFSADLQYIDDDPDSYSEIFDSAVFDIAESDKLRLIESLRKLSQGEELEDIVDVDEVLRYFACNVAMVNLDSYLSSMKHNYYLYEKDGKLSMLPWDYNLSFAAFQVGSASQAVNYPIDTAVSGVSLEERPILAKLLENQTYLDQYHAYLAEIAEKHWNTGAFQQKIQQLDQLIGSYVAQDPTAFYTYEQYQDALEALQQFVELRRQSILGQLYGQIPSTQQGQQENPDALLDTGSLQMSLMGQQGGGHEGGFGGPGTKRDHQDLPEQQGEAREAGGFRPPDRFGQQEMPDSSGIDLQALCLLTASALVLLASLFTASRFRRRKS